MPKKEPFTISVPAATLEDLRERLARTRFPRDFGNSNWEYGTNTAYLKELVEYWRTKYDWRKHEREMNSSPTTRLRSTGYRFISSTNPARDPTRSHSS
jgi:hypothetical protein